MQGFGRIRNGLCSQVVLNLEVIFYILQTENMKNVYEIIFAYTSTAMFTQRAIRNCILSGVCYDDREISEFICLRY